MREIYRYFDGMGMDVLEDVSLKQHTTFRIGGAADLFVVPKNVHQLSHVVKFATQNDIRFLLIGGGSNLLIPDEGFRGIIIKLGGEFCDCAQVADCVTAGSGVPLARLANFAMKHALSGLEFAAGIPGTVGGGVYMNAGAYGGEMSQVVVSACYLDESGDEHCVSGAGCEFGYRTSFFAGKRNIISKAEFRLNPSRCDAVKSVMSDLAARRRDKQPLEYPSAGSAFKRPVGGYAAALIEQAGLKGTRVGGAMVSDKHAGFIVNTGGATYRDVTELIRLVQHRVHEFCGVMLEPEIKIIRN